VYISITGEWQTTLLEATHV